MKMLKRILLPLQGPQDAEQALRFLEQRLFREPATITLFTVLPHTRPPWPVDAASAEQMEIHALRNAQHFLNEIAAKLTAMDHQVRVAAALGTPVEGILQEAKASNADLILMGSRGRHGVTRMVLGSVSHALLHQQTYPLMIFN
jgi:nucleotide-binding universal stress UspA family protein